MKTRYVSGFIEENGGVLLHQPEPGADRRGPWDLPTTQVAPGETAPAALERHLKTLFEIPFTIDDVMADVELSEGHSRVVHRITLDMSNGPPRKQKPGMMGFFGRNRLDESDMPAALIAALKPKKKKQQQKKR